MSFVRFAKSLLFVAAASLAGGSLPTSALAANTWLGAAIMPKSDQLQIQNDNQTVGGSYDIAWPATVTKTNGRWLWIEDEGGYRNPPVCGWVYADDVVKLDAARGFYSTELLKNKTAVLYWLRGIYWESQNEPAIAMADYQAAEARADQPLTIDDVAIRYGRLLAAQHMQNGVAPYKPASPPPDRWDAQFQAAERANGRPATLFRLGHGGDPEMPLPAQRKPGPVRCQELRAPGSESGNLCRQAYDASLRDRRRPAKNAGDKPEETA